MWPVEQQWPYQKYCFQYPIQHDREDINPITFPSQQSIKSEIIVLSLVNGPKSMSHDHL